ncbi:zf-TFIIB domain-containing protein [Microbacterium sp. H1-D42]|uniref:TFIIB-type zinc ribbon-containing protein n=1 Tax=Microbacterium sp. H1-D42 TaxID=2925844 RepID=UPI001F533E18|nr:zf-TFIIB domain-containing protein [Microbacterium sp. H1-D42]UNK71728.1 zf-TFIIB domain-containing protein [Microbacterium sp. H1-D42]
MDDLERQRRLRLERDALLDTPNCLACLHRMEPTDVDGVPVWQCPECGTTQPA